jgi:integrase
MALISITKTAVDKLAAKGPTPAFLWDDHVHGFGVKCTATGRKVFIAQYRPAGGRRSVTKRVTIGEYGTWTIDRARKKAKAILGAAADGQNPAAERAALRQAQTVAEAGSAWLAELEAKAKPSTFYEWSRIWRRELVPALGTQRAIDVTVDALSRLHLRMKARPIMANRTLNVASAFLRWCETRQIRPSGSNPARDVPRYRERAKERYLTHEELGRLSEALRRAETVGLLPAKKHRKHAKSELTRKHRPTNADDPRIATPFAVAAIRFLLLSGFRESEALTLRWSAVDAGRGMVTLEDSKTGKSIRPLGEPALELLQALPRMHGSDYVFSGREAGSHLSDLKRVWYAVLEAAELDGVRLHDLRHTVASVAASGGSSLLLIGRLLGHKDTKSTQRYAHLVEHAQRDLADRTAKEISEMLSARQ